MDERRRNYTVSIHYDRRLYKQDIAGSIVHARMLARQGIISRGEADAMVAGLESIRGEIEAGSFPWREDLEDIHMNVERRLSEMIGDTAGKLHTARSRNDQVALDIRMYTREVITEVLGAIHEVRKSVVEQARTNIRVVMPGYTHLQRAQPVLFAHHMLAYFEMFDRDRERFQQAYRRADVLPLGSGALAGVPYPVDRDFLARELGLGSISSNSMDAVADRDFLLDFHSAAAICMMHLSRLAEELIIWSSEEFAFVRLSDEYTTGSSMMPQKRNPDYAELARAKSGRVFGHLVGLLTVMKGLPLTYNRDLQEDKEGFFDTVDTLLATLSVFAGMLPSLQLRPDKMLEAAEGGYLLATDLADYLVRKGMPFREAHGVVSRLSAHALEKGIPFGELPLDTYKAFCELFERDVLETSVASSVDARDLPGGTALRQVERAIMEAEKALEAEVAR